MLTWLMKRRLKEEGVTERKYQVHPYFERSGDFGSSVVARELDSERFRSFYTASTGGH